MSWTFNLLVPIHDGTFELALTFSILDLTLVVFRFGFPVYQFGHFVYQLVHDEDCKLDR